MMNPDFWDFMMEGGYDLLFPDDNGQTFKCPLCGAVVSGDQKVEWIDKKEGKFKCPECGEEIRI